MLDGFDAKYSSDAHLVLRPEHIGECTALQATRRVPVDCQAALGAYLGQPLATIHRRGVALEDLPFVWASFGEKGFAIGSQRFRVHGVLRFEGGRPWARSELLTSVPQGDRVTNPPFTRVLLEPVGARRLRANGRLDLALGWQLPFGVSHWRGTAIGHELSLNVDNVVTNEQRALRVGALGEPSRYRGDYQRPRAYRLELVLRF